MVIMKNRILTGTENAEVNDINLSEPITLSDAKKANEELMKVILLT